MGQKVTAFSRELYGDPTWPIVSKKFDNLNPIPHHLHWAKWEVYDINSFDNPGVCPSHYHTTAMGLYPFVSKDDFLACMKSFGKGEYNGGASLPACDDAVGQWICDAKRGASFPHRSLHTRSPCDHGRTLSSLRISPLTVVLVRPMHSMHAVRKTIQRISMRTWEYLVDNFDFEANQDPDFVKKSSRPAITANEFASDGVDAQWIVYGNFLGDQKVSILRLTLAPGAKTTFRRMPDLISYQWR